MTCPRTIEIEVKFAVPGSLSPQDLHKALVGCGEVVAARHDEVRDVYLDRADLWLLHAGAALRCRTTGQAGELTLKAVRRLKPGAATARAEQTEHLDAAPARLPRDLAGSRTFKWLSSLMGAPKLEVLFELEQERDVFVIYPDAGGKAEVSLDHVVIPERSAPPRVEIEVELKQGDPAILTPICQAIAARLTIEPSTDSKYEYGLRAAGLGLPRAAEEAWRHADTDSFRAGARKTLGLHTVRLLRNEAGTRLGLDRSSLHDMRVACRRLREGIRFFAMALPASHLPGWKRELKWLGKALGGVRDIDVYLRELERDCLELPPQTVGALQAYFVQLWHDREAARTEMLRALNSKRYTHLCERLEALSEEEASRRWRSSGDGLLPLVQVAPGLIHRRLRQVLKAGRKLEADATDAAFHRLRIKCKRLRYACEYVRDIYGKPLAGFVREVVVLQDILGDHQDAVVAQQLLSRVLDPSSPLQGCAPSFFYAMGQLGQLKATQARSTREAFFRDWRRFDRKKVRRPLLECLARRETVSHNVGHEETTD